MIRLKSTLLIVLGFTLFLVSCGGGKSQKASEAPVQTAKIDLAIEGMTCTGCENTICSNLEKLPGVKSVTASHVDGRAVIEFEPGKVDTVKIKETVDGLGYKAVRASAVEPGGSE